MAAPYGRSVSDESFVFVDINEPHSTKKDPSPNAPNTALTTTNPIDIKQTVPASGDASVSSSLPSPISKRTSPLTEEIFLKFLDPDGRLVDESLFRKTIFLGGIEPDARKLVWQFLFGLYSYSSTKREREALLLDYAVKYHEMKSRWKTLLSLHAKPGATDLEKGLVASYQLPDSQRHLYSPEVGRDFQSLTDSPCLETDISTSEIDLGPDFSSLSLNFEGLDLNSNETKQQIEFMKLQAQVYVNRHKVDMEEFMSSLRLIDKDVPRTDRNFEFFSGSQNQSLTKLRDILITYSAFNIDIGYVQGMNDILARFLYVFNSEVEAYWCFHNYIDSIKEDFLEQGMVRKIAMVRQLLQEMDPDLLGYLEQQDLGDLLFCHRWLLLGFKREFSFLESLQVFEILSSHHLELSSVEAEMARHKQQMKEFATIGGVIRTAPKVAETEYTFELFMCVALLLQCRDTLLTCVDNAMVYECINNLKIDLGVVLEKSEQLFFSYCKKTVEDSFLMIETPSPR